MTPSNRTVLNVERLEDRCTPGRFQTLASVLASHVHHQDRICAALQRAEQKAIAHGATKIVNIINTLQNALGCNTPTSIVRVKG